MHEQNGDDGTGRGSALLERAIPIWRKAQVFYAYPSWEGEPRAVAMAEEIAQSHPECETALATLLLDPSQLVAAYALRTLETMESPLLQEIPPEVLQRRSRVTFTSGSIKWTTDLGWMARRAQRWARERAGLPPAPPSREVREVGLPAEH